MRSEQEMREWISKKRRRYDRYSEVDAWDCDLSTRISRTHSLHLKALNVATYKLILGESRSAQEWFRRAAESARMHGELAVAHHEADDVAQTRIRSAPKLFAAAVESALLSGSPECIEETATTILSVDESFRDVVDSLGGSILTYEESRLLAALSIKRDEIARTHLDQAREFVSDANYDEYHSGVPAGHSGPLATASKGLIEGDAEAVETAIAEMVATHGRRIDGEPRGQKEVMDHTAAAMLMLSRKRGLDVTVESEFIPDALVE